MWKSRHPPVYVSRRHKLDVGHRFHLWQDLRGADTDDGNTEPQSAVNELLGVYSFCHRQFSFDYELPLVYVIELGAVVPQNFALVVLGNFKL